MLMKFEIDNPYWTKFNWNPNAFVQISISATPYYINSTLSFSIFFYSPELIEFSLIFEVVIYNMILQKKKNLKNH